MLYLFDFEFLSAVNGVNHRLYIERIDIIISQCFAPPIREQQIRDICMLSPAVFGTSAKNFTGQCESLRDTQGDAIILCLLIANWLIRGHVSP